MEPLYLRVPGYIECELFKSLQTIYPTATASINLPLISLLTFSANLILFVQSLKMTDLAMFIKGSKQSGVNFLANK